MAGGPGCSEYCAVMDGMRHRVVVLGCGAVGRMLSEVSAVSGRAGRKLRRMALGAADERAMAEMERTPFHKIGNRPFTASEDALITAARVRARERRAAEVS